MTMQRRAFLGGAAAAFAGPVWCAAAAAAPVTALGAAWRGPAADDPQQLGVIDVDWARRSVTVRHAVTLPGRAHGLLAEPEGGLLAVAARPGSWLLRLDGRGRISRRQAIEGSGRSFDGHALASADGAWLYSGETDAQGRGWIGVRERTSLRKLDEWRTQGIDPHHMLLDADGHLMLANGGIARTPDGRKRDLDRMASSLVRIDHRNGGLLGQWTLGDPRLSLRHLAWNRPVGGEPRLLGVALQAEHDDPLRRAEAPLLALWDGATLRVPGAAAGSAGYAGDIAAAPGGGFALSAQRAGRGLVWLPQSPSPWQRFADLQEPCALAAPASGDDAGAVLLACGAGIARWHPGQGPALLRWPAPMALDNHWVPLV
jgi:hypothetical protein